jgi:hypothetical protein
MQQNKLIYGTCVIFGFIVLVDILAPEGYNRSWSIEYSSKELKLILFYNCDESFDVSGIRSMSPSWFGYEF